MKYFFILSISLVLSFNLSGQGHFCGTRDVDGSMMTRLEDNKIYSKKTKHLRDDLNWIYIPVQFHIVTLADGTGGVDETKILDELCTINKNYAPHKMKFYIAADFNIVKSANVYNDPGSSISEAKIKSVKSKSAVNIYIVNDIPSGSGAGQTLGYYSPILDVVVIRKNQIGINAQTVSHELGHFFSLAHPFYGWEGDPYDAAKHGNPVKIQKIKWGNTEFEIELVNRSNCNTTADKICDTPADYNFGLVDPEQDCKLNGPVLDFNLDTIKTMVNNYMSYFFNCGKYQFTPMQVAAMRADYNHSLRAYIRTGYIPDTSYIDPSTFTIITPENNGVTPTYNDVTIDWEDMVGAKKYVFFIYPSSSPSSIKKYFVNESKINLTDLEKNKRYFWSVKPFNEGNTCAAKTSSSVSFKTGQFGVGIEEEMQNEEDFSVFPNPSSKEDIFIYSKNAHSNAEIVIMNSLGQLMYKTKADLINGINHINLNKSNFENGFYTLGIKFDNETYIRKILIQ